MRRILIAVVALAIPASVATVGLSSPAFAVTTTICTTITGNISSTIVISGCTGGNTGGSSQPVVATSLATGGTITYVDSNTTTIGAATIKSPAKLVKKCRKLYGTGTSEDSVSGKVTASNTGIVPIPGKYSGAVCIDSAGNIHALKALKSN
jgi:hypothetical protein